MTAKECRNGCGRMIEWNNDLRYFQEVANGQRHMCPNWQSRQANTFEQNKQKWGSGYNAGTQANKMEVDVANLVGDVAVLKQQVSELQHTLSGLSKAIGEMSFKPASEIVDEEPIPDESTN